MTLVAETLPFQITDVTPDQGGDSRWVTMTIRGARFKPGALVKLVRPGIDEIEPVRYQVHRRHADHRHLRPAPARPRALRRRGDQPRRRAGAIVPYRYLVERALPIDVTIGLGGPRVLPAGQTGLYGISLQSLTNVDTPYVYFEFGAPEIGDNAKVYGPAVRDASTRTCAASPTACAPTCRGRASTPRSTPRLHARRRLRVRRDGRRLRRHELHRHHLPRPEGAGRPRLRGLQARAGRRPARLAKAGRSMAASPRSPAS